jgi:hypothetical protein
MILTVEPSKFVGLSLDDARAQITGYGYSYRVTMADGVKMPHRRDYDPLRINLKLQDNRVIEAVAG